MGVHHHTLSDFRVAHGERLERLLIESTAAMADQGIGPLETIAQDGMRVRGSAGTTIPSEIRNETRKAPT